MPHGPHDAPTVFQALVNNVLQYMLNHFVFVYLDDILIFFPCLSSALISARPPAVCQAEESEFHVSTVSFLGFIVSPYIIY